MKTHCEVWISSTYEKTGLFSSHCPRLYIPNAGKMLSGVCFQKNSRWLLKFAFLFLFGSNFLSSVQKRKSRSNMWMPKREFDYPDHLYCLRGPYLSYRCRRREQERHRIGWCVLADDDIQQDRWSELVGPFNRLFPSSTEEESTIENSAFDTKAQNVDITLRTWAGGGSCLVPQICDFDTRFRKPVWDMTGDDVSRRSNWKLKGVEEAQVRNKCFTTFFKGS